MRVKIVLIAEIEVSEEEAGQNPMGVALAKLDAFREAIIPSQNWGISFYRPYDQHGFIKVDDIANCFD